MCKIIARLSRFFKRFGKKKYVRIDDYVPIKDNLREPDTICDFNDYCPQCPDKETCEHYKAAESEENSAKVEEAAAEDNINNLETEDLLESNVDHKMFDRIDYLNNLAKEATFKVSDAMINGFLSTRIQIDMVRLEGNVEGLATSIMAHNPYVRKVTYRKIGDKRYAVLHIAHNEDKSYATREELKNK